jgi:hypothetical protein
VKGHLLPNEFDCVKCGIRMRMDEMVLRPAEGVQEEQTKVSRVPWLERRERGRLSGWFWTVMQSMGSPGRLVRGLPAESSQAQAWLYALITMSAIMFCGAALPLSVISLILLLTGKSNAPEPLLVGLGIMFFGTATVMVLAWVWAAVTHGMLRITGGCEYGMSRTVQCILYGCGTQSALAVPIVGLYCGSWIIPLWWIVAELCLRHGETAIVDTTLRRMCEGGIFDQLGGGFCRYSVDAEWRIPHFEKMLYDNGPLLALLADAWRVNREDLYARCATATAGWIMREMQSPEGGYYSSLDADSEHEEGKFYVWDRDEARALLDAGEWAALAPHFGLDGPPNFEGRHWHLHVARPLQEAAAMPLNAAKAKLLAAREKRIRPGRDEKVLVSWNALAIAGMARAGRVFGEAAWLGSARRALDFVRSRMWQGGRLLATYKDGRAHLNAYLDDYAFLMLALVELLQAQFRAEDLAFAEALAEVALEQFEDREAGGFFFTARDHERLIHRPKPGHDQATPSGNGAAALALNRLAALTGETRYADAAERTLRLFLSGMRAQPAGYAMLLAALEEWLEPPATAIMRGAPAALRAWSGAMAGEYLPRTLVLAIPSGLAGLPPVLDKPASPRVQAWLCRGAVCLPPFDSLDALRDACRA